MSFLATVPRETPGTAQSLLLPVINAMTYSQWGGCVSARSVWSAGYSPALVSYSKAGEYLHLTRNFPY
jgi:hypothetical protein